MNTPDSDAMREMNKADIEAWREFHEIQVPISVELGRTTMTAKEFLALELHGIIQLQRSTGEGVDVIAGDRRLARGEVIMIEDRTGVRVNEVIM